MYHRCQKCGKQLTDPESMIRGYGPECWGEIVRAVASAMDSDAGQIPGQMSIWDLMENDKEIDDAGTEEIL